MTEFLKRYKNHGERLPVQAQRVWIILVARVQWFKKSGLHEVLITYGDLAEAMGMDRRAGRTLARPLWIIGRICLDNDVPALNSIVVNAKDNEPGSGVIHHSTRSVTQEQKAVAKFDWFTIRPPSTGMLRRVWEGIPDDIAA
jgi:hypothetical protein